ncbi:MAG: NAD(+)/NADH kinase [Planctomycetota bacterium]|jgi:NAD+ kinase
MSSSTPSPRGSSSGSALLPTGRLPRILVLGDGDKAQAREIGEQIADLLDGRAKLLGIDLVRSYEPIASRPDLVIVLGGDGALLAASHRLGQRRVPVMGVNLGKVGFLAAVAPERLATVMDLLFAGKVRTEDRAMMRFRVRRDGEVVLDSHVLNEIVISRSAKRSMIQLDLIDERRPVASFSGDGVIVSTATGSTAYNLSAGGPILAPSLEALVVQPLAPYALGIRSLVLRNDRQFKICVHGPALLNSDGHLEGKLQAEDHVLIGPSKRRLCLVVDPENRFYARLRSKLHWGEEPQAG